MNQKPQLNARPTRPEMSDEELEQDVHAIELPAREAFSLVFSSPTFLHAGRAIEQIMPPEPAPDVTPTE